MECVGMWWKLADNISIYLYKNVDKFSNKIINNHGIRIVKKI